MRAPLTVLMLAAVAPLALGQTCMSMNANPARNDWFVDATATNPTATGSKADPFQSLGAAILVADDNDRILVAPGVYAPSTTAELYGYILGSSAVVSQLNIQIIGTAGAAATILDAENGASGNGILRFRIGASGAKLRGFTLRNFGGGLGMIRLGSTTPGFEAHDVEISHCIFENSNPGSGIATFGASDGLKIHDNVFNNCNDNAVWASDITTNANPCSGASGGGAIYNNTIVNGGNVGIRLQGGTWQVFDNIVFNNAGSGIYHENAVPPPVVSYTIDYNCFFGNNPDYGAGITPGANDVVADPLFVNAMSDFHLMAGSPCLDAGKPALPGYVASDMDGDPRILRGPSGSVRAEIGADEVTDVRHGVGGPASISFGIVTYDVMGPPGEFVLRAIALGTGNIPLSEGNLLLDLSSLILLDATPGVIPAGGVLSLPILIVGLPPSAVGATIWSQAVVIGPVNARLTNAALTVICP